MKNTKIKLRATLKKLPTLRATAKAPSPRVNFRRVA